jgi:2-dehydropantoate 2-reductase
LDSLKILITGAGIIGTIYGWALAEAGHEVVHFVRTGRAARFSNGIAMDVYDRRQGRKRYFRGQYLLKVTEAAAPSDNYELVIVPTKHFHLEQALAQLVPNVGPADFILLTQNWNGTDAIDAMLPRARYAYGDAKAGGTFSDQMLMATIASLDLGPAEGAVTPLAQKAGTLCESAGIPVALHEDMLHYLWVQYAITGGFGRRWCVPAAWRRRSATVRPV